MYVHIIMIKKKQKQKKQTKKHTQTQKHTHKIHKKPTENNKKIPLKYFHVTACVINNKISNIVYISFVRYICSMNSKVYMLKYALTMITI